MRICDIDGCGRRHVARGLCRRHYQRLQNTGSPEGHKSRVSRPIRVCGDVAYISLANGRGETVIDAADVAQAAGHSWRYEGRYANTTINKRTVGLHRLLMGEPPGQLVDHRNGNRLDNRRGNLRIGGKQQNAWNSKAQGRTSKFKGVSLDKSGAWVAALSVKFGDEEEAARMYDVLAKVAFGEWARTNEDLGLL